MRFRRCASGCPPGKVPFQDGHVPAGRGESFAVERERKGIHHSLVSLEADSLLAGDCLDNANLAADREREGSAVWSKR